MAGWRFIYSRPGVGLVPQRGVITVRPSGEVLDKHVYDPEIDGPADRPTSTYIYSGSVVDRPLAAYIASHGYRAHLEKLEEPDLGRFCVVCGALDCGGLATAVSDAQAKRVRSVTVGEDGVVTAADQHAVYCYENAGLDWRSTAVMLSRVYRAPYRVWFREPWPSPQIPADAAPRLPQAEQPITTPKVVKQWYSEKVSAGAARPLSLPEPDVRKTLRERAGLSKPAMAARVGCTASAIGMWEAGKRTPTGEMAQRYLVELQTLVGEVGDPLDPTVTGTSRVPHDERPAGCRCTDPLGRPCPIKGHNVVSLAQRRRRAVADAQWARVAAANQPVAVARSQVERDALRAQGWNIQA